MSTKEKIFHYKRSILHPKSDNARLKHCISRLSSLPVTVGHLQDTGIGKTVNALRKHEDGVGESARALVKKWKDMVHQAYASDDEDEACVPDAPESYDSPSPVEDSDVDRSSSRSFHKRRNQNAALLKDSSPPEKLIIDNDRCDDEEDEPEENEDLEPRRSSNDNVASTSREKHWRDRHTASSKVVPDRAIEETKRKPQKQIINSEDEESNCTPNPVNSCDSSKKSHDSQKHKSAYKDKHSKTEEKKKVSDTAKEKFSKSTHSSSSSSSKHKSIKDSKHAKSDRKKDHEKSRSQEKSKKRHSSTHSIDGNSGTSFADALGMCTKPPPSKKKKDSPSKSTSSKSSSLSSSKKKDKKELRDSSSSLPLMPPLAELEPLKLNFDVDVDATLPEISTNYKPFPILSVKDTNQRAQDDKLLEEAFFSKTQRTKVYSGNKTGYTSVLTLQEWCVKVIVENIELLDETGGVPYDIMKLILLKVSAARLLHIENINPYLIQDTEELWQTHCQKEFKTKKRLDGESWRDMYRRCEEERQTKLEKLRDNFKQLKEKPAQVRSTKLAYVDTHVVKPPRNILRKQAKFGTGNEIPVKPMSDVKKKLIGSCLGGAGPSNVSIPSISVPVPLGVRARQAMNQKKIKAPLMQKALQAIKGTRFKR